MVWVELGLWSRLPNHVHVRTTVRVVLLAIVGRELVLVLKEGVLMALGTSRAARNIARNMIGLVSTTGIAFPGGVDFVKLGSPSVHVARPWVLGRTTVGHRIGERVLSPDHAPTPFLSCPFHWLLVRQRELFNTCTVHLELALISEEVLSVATGTVAVGRP